MDRNERRRALAYEVQRLHNAGRSKRQIARDLAIGRGTVADLLEELERRRRDGESAIERVVDAPRVPKPSKLDPFVDRIKKWLHEWPDLKATRCREKLIEEYGFDGGYSIVRDKLRQLKSELGLPPARPPAVPITTAPGQRAEFDWSPYKLASGAKVQLWNAQLRCSRAPYLSDEDNQRQPAILRCLRAAFEEWGGVPQQTMTDNMPGVVDRRERGQAILNVKFVDFASYYDFEVLIARPGCPTWKAIAERMYRTHEEGLLNGRTIHTRAEYGQLLSWWREQLLARQHPEQKGRSVAEMLELERLQLKPLPAHPYDVRDVVVRVVNDYGRVALDTNEYPASAPVGARIYVCADAERVVICDARARRLIEHERLPDGAGIKLDPLQGSRRRRYDTDELIARIGEWGDTAFAYASAMRGAKRAVGPDLSRLLQLQLRWSTDDIVAAMEHATIFGQFSLGGLERILDRRFTPRSHQDQVADRSRRRIRGLIDQHPVGQRDLSAYEELASGRDESEGGDDDDESRD